MVRNKVSPDFGKIFSSAFGVLGKIIATAFTWLIVKPVHWLTFSTVGKLYNKRVDSPFLGSALYTILHIIILFIIAGILKGILN